MSDSIRALASSMVLRKRANSSPYILFLGTGASVCSGCSNTMQIVDDVLRLYAKSEFDKWEEEIKKNISLNEKCRRLLTKQIDEKKCTRCYDIWDRFDPETKYSILKSHLSEDKEPSEGYEALVQLMKNGFISTVFSTNLDNLLERALSKAKLYNSQDYIVLKNGLNDPTSIEEKLDSNNPSYKILKLHGSLDSDYYAFAPKEIFDFERKFNFRASRFIKKSLIIVGYDVQDRDLPVFYEKDEKEIYFVNPTVSESRHEKFIFNNRRKVSIIDGEDGNFDTFFKKLLQYTEKFDENNVSSQYVEKMFNNSPEIRNVTNAKANETVNKSKIPIKFCDSYTDMEFVLIPAGIVNNIKINTPFYMGVYPVTQKQWKTVMQYNNSEFQDENHPVESISWYEVQDFIKRLNEIEKTDRYCLPSEVKWEYACRAGTTTKYHYGNEASELDTYAWFADNSNSETHPVGKKEPNRWGLYDMHGNVSEWCQDEWLNNFEDSSTDGSARESKSSAFRVYRGGDFCCPNRSCHSSYRTAADPGSKFNNIGFRVLKNL